LIERLEHRLTAIWPASILTKKGRIQLPEKPRIMIGSPPQHDPIEPESISRGERFLTGLDGAQPPIEDKGQVREIVFELAHDRVSKRRHFSVLLWRESFEYGRTRMHDKHAAARQRNRPNKISYKGVVISLIHADAMLDRDRAIHGIPHGLHPLCN
jgi:hypothetical protein